MKTLSVCMIVYNEEQLLQYTFPQIYDLADQIVIVNGSPFGPSTDNTKEIIGPYLDSEKVVYKEGTYGEPFNYNKSFNSVMRNEYLKRATGDWILQLDADEFWSWDDIEEIKSIINEPCYSDTTGINTGNIHFYIDVFHFLKGVGENMHHRIVKNIPGSYYSDTRPNSILYLPHHQPVATSRRMLDRKDIRCFHVGHAIPWNAYKKKQSKFFYKNLARNCWNVKSIEELDALEEQRDFNHPKLLEYKGIYPEFMKQAIEDDHPYFRRVIDERKPNNIYP